MRTPFLTCIYFLTLLSIGCGVGCSRQGDPLTDIEGVSLLEVERSSSNSFAELAWSPDGRSVAARVSAVRSNSTVTAIDLQTGETRRLFEASGEYFLGPEWSPDGQSLVFVAPTSNANPRSGGVIVVDVDNGNITHDLGFGGYATWTMDSEHIIVVGFSSSCQGETPIDVYDLTTDLIRTIGQTVGCRPATADSLDVSVLEKLVVPNVDGTNSQILDIADGTVRGTLTPTNAASTIWSPDGTMLAFIAKKMASGMPTDSIVLASADGACLSAPLELNTYLYSLDWSPDGSRLVFSTRDVNRLYFLDLTTGVGKQLMDSYRERCAE